MTRVAVLFSGGLDSTVLVAQLLEQGHEVTTLGVHYGQRHVRELQSARSIAAVLGVPFQLVSLPHLGQLLPSSLTGGPGDKVVPNRNAILTMVAVGWASSHGWDAVALGVNAGDAVDFYDCRPGFFALLDGVAHANGVELWTPFIEYPKGQIVAMGMHLGVPLDETWSCYLGWESPCGTCDACTDRALARGLDAVSS